MHRRPEPERIRHVASILGRARLNTLELEQRHTDELSRVHPDFAASGRNLLHYLALRQEDLTAVQPELEQLGLSTLGRTESHALAGLEAVLDTLDSVLGTEPERRPAPPVDHEVGRRRLRQHTKALLGPRPDRRFVRVMVTLPTDAASDAELVHDLVAAGMNVARINAAHHDPYAWAAMVDNVRRAERAVGRTCRVLFDLAGPKLRTGAMSRSARVLRWRPRRDLRGHTLALARVGFLAAGASARSVGLAEDDLVVPIAGDLLEQVEVGDVLVVHDTRGRRRRFDVVESIAGAGCIGECGRGGRVETNAVVELTRNGNAVATSAVDELPLVDEPLVLRVGDPVLIVPADEMGCDAERDPDGNIVAPARVPCTLPSVFRDVRAGESIWFDDGKLGGRIESVDEQGIHVRITSARRKGSRLASDKGINLPDSELAAAGMTSKDIADLDFAVRHADMIALSFVERPDDVHRLIDELAARGADDLGILIKVETRRAFAQLPKLLLAGMRSPALGVIVARGDLAVEIGFARMAEVQEEILWLCEAAHVPVVWATQVLESLAKRGRPSRAEVTDAAMGVRAECVMLNKGPHVVDAVRFLEDVLHRMERHQFKKTPLLGRLAVSDIE